MSFSRFFLCDLHVHTPADRRQEYGDFGTNDPTPKTARQVIAAHAAAGVQIIAVTDHNRVDWYPAMKDAGELQGVHVFPGVELSVNGCHLVAIWDTSPQAYELAQRFVRSLWAPGVDPFEANGDPRPVSSGQVLDIARRAVEHKALVFAPHSTARRIGVFASGVCRNSAEVAKSPLIMAFDVVGASNADVLVNPRSQFGQTPPRWFLSGDTRSFAAIGRRAIYLKLGATPDLEGLRQSFLVPETRLRLPEHLRAQWGHVAGLNFIESPVPSWPRITEVTIRGGFHADLRLHFAPGLNAVIGGKGTGKSTLIEILRYVLHGGDPVDVESVSNRRANFGPNADAAIGFIDLNGDEYRVVRSGGPVDARLLRGGQETGVPVPRRVNVRVFGQRELQALSKRKDLLRDFVAHEVGFEWEQVLGRERTSLDALVRLESELASLEVTLAGLEEHATELADARDKLSLAEEKGAAELIQQSKRLGEVGRSVSSVAGWPKTLSTTLDQLEALLPAPSPMPHPLVPPGLASALRPLEEKVRGSLSDLRQEIAGAVAELAQELTSWSTKRATEQQRLHAALADAGIADPVELGRLQENVSRLLQVIRDQPEKTARYDQVASDRRALLVELHETRRLKSRLIESAARKLNERVGDRIRVTVDPMSDFTVSLQFLDILLRGQSVRREQIRHLAELPPAQVAQAIRGGTQSLVDLGCSVSTAAKLVALSAAEVRRLEETDVPDRLAVQMDLGEAGANRWVDVESASPGQRATALLAVALASGDEPLIIDQPEDDLDNRYIYDEVVKSLRARCQGRQVIVATHNANIPVLGDAEYILALDADSGHSRVLAAGGLELPAVSDEARRILEGGHEAFQARQRRYEAVSL